MQTVWIPTLPKQMTSYLNYKKSSQNNQLKQQFYQYNSQSLTSP
jgi:hypothetical protein